LKPTGTDRSEKIVLAANALQRRCPTPARPPVGFRHGHHGSLFINTGPLGGPLGLITMTLSPLLYGLIHFLAWGERFPTPLKQQLWHVSLFVVMCSGLMCVPVGKSLILMTWKYRWTRSISQTIFIILCFWMIPSVHMLASVFLLTESCRQLFFLDPAAYQLPSWSNYWPHLS